MHRGKINDCCHARRKWVTMVGRTVLFCINVCMSVYDAIEYKTMILLVYYLGGCPVNVSQNEGNLVNVSWSRGLCRLWLLIIHK